MDEKIVLAFVLGVAFLYGSVGHGGASGYLAMLSLLAVPLSVMKPTALLLNLLVAGLAAIQYARAGHFRAALLWPFAAASIPCCYLGAQIHVPPKTYAVLLSVTLAWAAVRLIFWRGQTSTLVQRPLPRLPWTLAAGACLGLLSGLVGVGGGIFLSPLFLFMGWANVKETAAVSAAFIWLNSLAGMAGHLQSGVTFVDGWPLWLAAAGLGGWVGASLGAHRWSPTRLCRALAAVLLIASTKLILR